MNFFKKHKILTRVLIAILILILIIVGLGVVRHEQIEPHQL